MYRQKTDWDYVTELMTLIPGVVSLFTDDAEMKEERADDAPERRAIAHGIAEHYQN